MKFTPESAASNVLGIAAVADAAWLRDELAYAWLTAHEEAVVAYYAWHDSPGSGGYTAYRAAQDRADRAQDVLASTARLGAA